jgi:putative hydrolase of the HAD superfamily
MSRAIAFDLDDTLYPERAYVASGFAAVAAEMGREFPELDDLAASLWRLFEQDPKAPVFDRLAEQYRREQAADIAARMLQVYRTHRPRIRLFDDAEACLEACVRLGRLALVTDGRLDGQQAKIDALGIGHWFGCVILTDAWGKEFWKPHPRAFEHVEKELGCRGGDCVYVADNPRKDFVAPNRMGWHTVRLAHPLALTADRETAEGGEPGHRISALREVPLLLGRLWDRAAGAAEDHVE